MSRSNVPYEDAKSLIDRVCAEVGNRTVQLAQFLKIENPTTKQRIVVKYGKTLGQIDTTLPVSGQPGTYGLSKPNGSITCHIEPSLDALERFIRMLADPATAHQVTNRPKPFAFVKGPAPRTPASAVQQASPSTMVIRPGAQAKSKQEQDRHDELVSRVNYLKQRRRVAQARMLEEERGVPHDIADMVAQGKLTVDEAIDAARNASSSELVDVLADTGIEVE